MRTAICSTPPELRDTGWDAVIWRRHRDTAYDEVAELLAGSHTHTIALIETHSDEELFTRVHYPWTKSTTLGAYFVSSTSSHYVWAQKTLRRIGKALPAA